jgi:steroid delta-isomerase-like uncharacterized protein
MQEEAGESQEVQAGEGGGQPLVVPGQAPGPAGVGGAARLPRAAPTDRLRPIGYLGRTSPQGDTRMTAAEHKAVVRRWVAAWNAQDLDAAEALLAPEYVRHDANLPDVVGPQAERQFIAGALGAFPDLHFDIEQLVAEGDLVMGRYTARGTHLGTFLGVPATGRTVVFQAVESYRLAGGRIAEQWVVMDALGLLQQLGAVPGPG